MTFQARRKQLESGAAKKEETLILKTPQQKGFYILFKKKPGVGAMLSPVLLFWKREKMRN